MIPPVLSLARTHRIKSLTARKLRTADWCWIHQLIKYLSGRRTEGQRSRSARKKRSIALSLPRNLRMLRGSTHQDTYLMKKKFLAVAFLIALGPFVFNSCDTPVGQGAGWGAATGAIIGGAATGHVRGAAIGAAAGAAAGALIGAAVEEDQAARYGPPPPGGFPFGRWAGTPGFYYSPYTGRVYDLHGVPPGGLTRDVDTGRLFRKP
jgi:hypothetical protein